MPLVTAVASFDHNGNRKVGDAFEVSDRIANQLIKRGLVVPGASAGLEPDPIPPAGTQSSASPAGQASQPQTASESGSGDTVQADPAEPAEPVEPTKPETKAGRKGQAGR